MRHAGGLVGLARLAVGPAMILTGAGCATSAPRVDVQANRYRIEVWLEPSSHHIAGRTIMDLTRVGEVSPEAGPVRVDFLLHPDLTVERARTIGVASRRGDSWRPTQTEAGTWGPQVHSVLLRHDVDAFSLEVSYKGTLQQDVAAGEKPGDVHNREMRAHIGPEGIYLADGFWYPQPSVRDGGVPALADFELLASRVPGMELVAAADPEPSLDRDGQRLAWRSPYPLRNMVFVGGAHEAYRTTGATVDMVVQVPASQAEFAPPWSNAARRTLERYEPLLGPYPARQFSVVSNFFSSGFAFPTFTLLSPAVIGMGERAADTHGYLDHEMLHCWWGNGVFVDPRDGNWCESLATYAANHYGYVLDGNEQEARRVRRNYCHSLSRPSEEAERPLGTYERPDGCSRAVAYQKGAMVFHMLARKMGQDRFWEATRRFNASHLGKYASWVDIQRAYEEVHGESLEAFFSQWVRRSGAPVVRVDEAEYDADAEELSLRLSQQEPPFELEIPIRVGHERGAVDVIVALRQPVEEVTIPLPVEPTTVELDPDFNVFRRAALEDIVPTTATIRSGGALVTVVPAGPLAEEYQKFKARLESSFADEKQATRVAGLIEPGGLAHGSVLILGDSVRDAYVLGLLSAIDFPVRFTDLGFEFEGTAYVEPGHSVVCTVANPGGAGGVTVFRANAEASVPSAGAVSMYDHSLVIFQDRRPILRRDFEKRRIVVVNE